MYVVLSVFTYVYIRLCAHVVISSSRYLFRSFFLLCLVFFSYLVRYVFCSSVHSLVVRFVFM